MKQATRLQHPMKYADNYRKAVVTPEDGDLYIKYGGIWYPIIRDADGPDVRRLRAENDEDSTSREIRTIT